MKTRTLFASVAVLSLIAAAGSALAAGKGRPTATKGPLAIPEGGPDTDAKGVVDTKHFPAVGKRVERSWLRFRLGKLDGTDYTVWMDDPSTPEIVLTQVATLTANEDGKVNNRIDTKHGGTMPFGATLESLVGMAVEVRDASGVVVLSGSMPAPKPHPAHPAH